MIEAVRAVIPCGDRYVPKAGEAQAAGGSVELHSIRRAVMAYTMQQLAANCRAAMAAATDAERAHFEDVAAIAEHD